MSVLDSYMKDLAELVNKDRGTANIAGVTEAAKIMKGHLESIGFKADLVDLGPNAGNGLFATNKPNADRYDVLFNAHLDTVFPDGTAAARPLTVKGDRAYGPGCSDCKSGVLAIYYALKAARPEDLERLSIAVALNPDEETGSRLPAPGSRASPPNLPALWFLKQPAPAVSSSAPERVLPTTS